MTTDYERKQLERVREGGPGEDESHFRMRVWGAATTKTLDIDDGQLSRVIDAVCGETTERDGFPAITVTMHPGQWRSVLRVLDRDRHQKEKFIREQTAAGELRHSEAAAWLVDLKRREEAIMEACREACERDPDWRQFFDGSPVVGEEWAGA